MSRHRPPPFRGKPQVLNERLGDAASCLKFALPDLRVGTLDALLTLSDDLVKTGSLVEAVAAKIRRTLGDLEPDSAEARPPPPPLRARAAALARAARGGAVGREP